MRRVIMIPLFIVAIFITGCKAEKQVLPDSPENISVLASIAIKNKNYEVLRSYFTDANREVLDEQIIKELNGLNSPETEMKTFSYLKIDNQVFLLDIIKDPTSKDYKIQNIIIVPKEYDHIFDNATH